MTSTQPRKRPQRRSEIPRGPQQDTGLQQIRDTLPPAPAPCTVEPAPRPVGEEVPPELLALVTHHCRRINAYLARAQHLQTLHGDSMKQWQRLVLYALTDALAHTPPHRHSRRLPPAPGPRRRPAAPLPAVPGP